MSKIRESELPEDSIEHLMPNPKKPPHKHRKKTLVITALLVVAGLTIITFYYFKRQTAVVLPSSNTSTSKENTPTVTDNKLRIVATGDMIGHDSLNDTAKKSDGSYDYLQFMDNMKPYFERADVRFCNQATLAGGTKFGISGYPSFNAPVELSRDMAGVGCNVINTGSNHSNDKTQAVIDASVAAWDNLPDILAVAGANRSEKEKQKVRYFEVDGVKFAFLSYTTYLNSPNKTAYSVTMYDQELVSKQVSEARKKSDIVIVSMRWGTEYSSGINSSQASQSQFLADQGADIIVGHGPHVLEPVKKLKSKGGRSTYVWYSLGNFLNTQINIESLISGFAVMDVDKESKKITDIGYLPVYMHYEWTSQQKKSEDLLARKNFDMYLLEESSKYLSISQNNTTVSAQMKRVKDLLNKYTSVPILTKSDYLK